ncbi:MAG: hypothetical protein ABIP35_14190 [Ginsengibacter sp.]
MPTIPLKVQDDGRVYIEAGEEILGCNQIEYAARCGSKGKRKVVNDASLEKFDC